MQYFGFQIAATSIIFLALSFLFVTHERVVRGGKKIKIFAISLLAISGFSLFTGLLIMIWS